jgi:hypothetical protein
MSDTQTDKADQVDEVKAFADALLEKIGGLGDAPRLQIAGSKIIECVSWLDAHRAEILRRGKT